MFSALGDGASVFPAPGALTEGHTGVRCGQGRREAPGGAAASQRGCDSRAEEVKRRRPVPPPTPCPQQRRGRRLGGVARTGRCRSVPPPPELLLARARGLLLPSRASHRPRPASCDLRQPGPGSTLVLDGTAARRRPLRVLRTAQKNRGGTPRRLARFQASRPSPCHI